MRRFKKLTAGLLSACLSLQLLTTGVVSASEVNDDTVITESIEDDIVGNTKDEAEEITELDTEYDVEVDGNTETEKWFKFVPARTGNYLIYSKGESDTCGYLYDSDGIDVKDDDDSGENSNFKIATELTEGETYFIKARLYTQSDSGSFKVIVSEDKELYAYASDTENTDAYPEVVPGETTILAVDVQAYDISSVTYEWQIFDNDSWEYITIDDATTDSYTTGPIEKSTDYRCVVRDGLENEVTVNFYVRISNQLNAYPVGGEESDDSLEVKIKPNETTTIAVAVSANDTTGITYKWYDSYGEEIDGATESSLEIGPITGTCDYYCEVYDQYGSNDCVSFSISVDNSFVAYPDGAENPDVDSIDFSVAPNSQKELSVIVSADDTSQISYRWVDRSTYEELEGGTGSSYVIEQVSGTYYYSCEVSDQYGNSKTIYFDVTVDNSFHASPDPEEWDVTSTYVSVKPNKSFTLTAYVSADDMDHITYQWWDGYSGEPIEGATGETCTINGVTEGRTYYCQVDDGYDHSATLWYYLSVDNSFNAYPTDAEDHDSNQMSYKVSPNEPLTLSVTVEADDADGITYTWYDNDGNELDYDGSAFEIEAVTSAAGYYCCVQDKYSNSEEIWFHVTVENHFTAYPTGAASSEDDNIEYSVKPNEGQVLSVTVTADDTDHITYRWWNDVTCEEIEGVTGSSYELEHVNGYERYCCTVSDPYGSSRTLFFYLSVDNSFKVYPTDAEDPDEDYISYRVPPTSSQTLSVTVEADDTEGITYTWYDGEENELDYKGNAFEIASVTSVSNYRCYVKDKYGSDGNVWFSVAVENHLKAWPTEAEDQNTDYIEYRLAPNTGKVLSVSVDADDKSGITYEWVDGVTGETIDGATGSSFEIEHVNQPAYYYCYVRDQYGSYRSVEFDVSVENHLEVTGPDDADYDWQGYRYSVKPNTALTLYVTATADDESGLTYRWEDNNGQLVSSSASYVIDHVTGAGYYSCTVSDQYGNSDSISIRVSVDNSFTAYPEGVSSSWGNTISHYLEFGASKELKVIVEAEDKTGITYKWVDNNGNVMTDVTGNSYVIEQLTGAVTYICYVTDRYGNYREVYFNVYVDNNLDVYPTEGGIGSDNTIYFSVEPNAAKILSVTATADDMEGLTYQWTDDEWNTIAGATEADYELPQVTEAGTYHCTVIDKYGNSETINFCISVDNGLVVYPSGSGAMDDDAMSFTVDPGAELTLFVGYEVIDPEGMTFKWYEDDSYGNSTQITGADEDSYTIDSVTEAKQYSCYVTDKYGNTGCAYFVVAVENHFQAWVTEATTTDQTFITLAVEPGTEKTLSVSVDADDTEGITYKWSRYNSGAYEYEKIQGASGSSFTVAEVTQNDDYRCIVTDKYGNQKNVDFRLSVNNHLVAYPADADSNSNSITYSVKPNAIKMLTVTVTATDTEGLTYRWNDSNWNMIAGASGNSFETPKVTRNTDYTCEVTDRYGNERNVYFYLTVDNDFEATIVGEDYYAINGNEADYYVAPNEQKTLGVSVTAEDMSEVEYQWSVYGTEKTGWKRIESATTATLTTAGITKYTQYQCYVHDQYGNDRYLYFNLHVENNLRAYVAGTKENEKTVSVKPNDRKNLAVDAYADHTENLSYRWYYLASDGWYTLISGASEASYQTNAISKSMKYMCTVTDCYGNTADVYFNANVDNDLHLYVAGTRLESVTLYVDPDTTRTLSVEAEADDLSGVTYEWYHNGTWICETSAANFTVSGITSYNGYTCKATDRFGNSSSCHFYLQMSGADVFEAYVAGTNNFSEMYSLQYGQEMTMAVDVVGADPAGLTYAWYREEGLSYDRIEGENGSTFHITSVKESHNYKCVVYDSEGQSRSVYFYTKVNHFDAFVTGTDHYHDMTYHLAPGANQTLSVTVTGDDLSGITYVWRERGTILDDASSNSLSLKNIRESTGFRCDVSDKYGNVEEIYISIDVNNLNAFVAGTSYDSADYLVEANASKTLAVDVTADVTDGVTYSWFEDDVLISGATSSSYTVNKLTANREYRCEVADPFGNERSVYFNLQVDNNLKAYVAGTTYTLDTISANVNDVLQLGVDVTATDTSGLTYCWYRKASEIEEATGATLTTDPITRSTWYRCKVTDRFGNYTSVTFNVEVNGLKAYVKGTTETETEVLVSKNGTASLAVDVVATEKSSLKYVWFKDDSFMESSVGKSTITTDKVTTAVNYRCNVSDKYGNSVNVSFIIKVDNVFSAYVSGTTDTKKAFYVTRDQTITLKADVTANDRNGLTYFWYRSYSEGPIEQMESESNSFTTDKITENRIYTCLVKDKYGNVAYLTYNVYIRVFTDVKDSKFFAESVYWAYENGITTGTSATTFSPNAGCTRADFVTFLWRAMGCPEPKTTTYFSDVKPKAYYYKAVMWAAAEGITTGYTGTDKFGAKDICKREQCVTFLYRAAGSPKITAEDHKDDKFTDVKKKQYYYDAVTWAAKNNITTGIDDTTFGVKVDCTRGQLVTFLQRYMNWRNSHHG